MVKADYEPLCERTRLPCGRWRGEDSPARAFGRCAILCYLNQQRSRLDEQMQSVRLLSIISVCAVALGPVTTSANAQRRPTAKEAQAIRTVAMRACGWPKYACSWHGARISTVDPHYGFGEAVYEGFGGVVVRRVAVAPLRYVVVMRLGGGAEPCSSFPFRLRRILIDLDQCFR